MRISSQGYQPNTRASCWSCGKPSTGYYTASYNACEYCGGTQASLGYWTPLRFCASCWEGRGGITIIKDNGCNTYTCDTCDGSGKVPGTCSHGIQGGHYTCEHYEVCDFTSHVVDN